MAPQGALCDREDEMRADHEQMRTERRRGPVGATRVPQQRELARPRLSDRERSVLVMYVSGLKMTSVARRLDISPHTAKEYLDRVRGKYVAVGRPAPTKVDLHREAMRDGLMGRDELIVH